MGEWKGALFGLVIVVICMAVIGYLFYEAWISFTGQLAIRKLEREADMADARAREAEADATRIREAAELAEAQAAIKKAQGEADALRREAEAAARVIEAGARTIDRQSFITMLYGILTPGGVVLAVGLAIIAGLAIGALGMLLGVMLARTGTTKDAGIFIRAYLRKQASSQYHKDTKK